MWKEKNPPTQVSCHFFCCWSWGVDNSTLCIRCVRFIFFLFRLLTFTFFTRFKIKKKIFSGFSSFCLLQAHSQRRERKNMLLRRRKAQKSTYIFQGFSRPSRRRQEGTQNECLSAEKHLDPCHGFSSRYSLLQSRLVNHQRIFQLRMLRNISTIP